jgi:predicted NUDIX family NTP pyrophosphohydrolase
VVCELIIGFLPVAVFGGRSEYGEVGHEGGAVGVDFSPRKAELRVVRVKSDPKFFKLRWLCGSERRGGLC